MRKYLPLVLVAAGAIALFAWNAVERDEAVPTTGGGPLDFVPADTPYVFALAEPLPAALSEAWLRQADPLVPLYVEQLRSGAAALREAAAPQPALAGVLEALAAEIEGKRMGEVLDATGFGRSPRMALYGLGLVPVLRLSLADPDAFRAFVARMEAAAGAALATASLQSQPYWRVALPESPLLLVMAVVDDQLVLALAPPDPAPVLPVLLGLERPRPALAGSDALDAMAERYGYLPTMLGFVDTGRLLVALTGEANALEQAYLAALDTTKPAPDPACAAEYRALATQWPRFSVGYTRLEAERIDARAVLESAPAIAADLMALRAPMPGLAAVDEDTLLHVGMSFNLEALPRLVERHARGIADAPYACPQLAWLNRGAEQARQAAANPGMFAAAPVFRGFHAVLEDLVLGAGMQPQSLRGALVIGSPNPRTLLSMAGSVLPQLGSLDLAADGSVAPLALPAMPGLPPQPAWVAMTGTQLAVGVGDGMEARLPRYLEDGEAQPVLVLGYAGRLYTLLADAMLQGAAAMPDPAARAELERQAGLMRDVYAHWIAHTAMRVEFTEHGIEVLQDMRMHAPR